MLHGLLSAQQHAYVLRRLVLLELQDRSGVHEDDHFQRKRAEDEGEGGVRIPLTVDVVYAYLMRHEYRLS